MLTGGGGSSGTGGGVQGPLRTNNAGTAGTATVASTLSTGNFRDSDGTTIQEVDLLVLYQVQEIVEVTIVELMDFQVVHHMTLILLVVQQVVHQVQVQMVDQGQEDQVVVEVLHKLTLDLPMVVLVEMVK